MSEYDDLKVLFAFHTNPEYMRPPELSPHQVLCGPHCPDQEADGRLVSMRTEWGDYDIRKVIERIPDGQKPDLLVVKADATRANFPRNLNALSIPKVMIIGDTGHLHQPLRSVVGYALQERYTYYVADHGRRHLHFFIEAGLRNVHWMPGLFVRIWDIPFQTTRTTPLSFIGQAGKYHPNRVQMLERLQKEKKPLSFGRAPQQQAFEIYAKSLITINLSLNGDINLRVFEALAAGGFLLSDKVERQAGDDLFFRDGEHLVLWENLDDLCEKIDYYLAHPDEAVAIAQRGYTEFHRAHRPERKRRQFLDMVFKGWLDPLHAGTRDRRALALTQPESAAFSFRLSQVEYLQAFHKEIRGWNLLFFPEADIRLMCDLADLPRFHLYRVGEHHPELFSRAEVDDQIGLVSPFALGDDDGPWHVVALAARELTSPYIQGFLGQTLPETLLVTDFVLDSAKPFLQQLQPVLADLGYQAAGREWPGFFTNIQ